jgi:hypothetical protein
MLRTTGTDHDKFILHPLQFTVFILPLDAGSRDSAIGTAAGYGLDGREIEFDFQQDQENCLLSAASRPALGFTRSQIQWVLENFSLRVKRQRHEAGHSTTILC